MPSKKQKEMAALMSQRDNEVEYARILKMEELTSFRKEILSRKAPDMENLVVGELFNKKYPAFSTKEGLIEDSEYSVIDINLTSLFYVPGIDRIAVINELEPDEFEITSLEVLDNWNYTNETREVPPQTGFMLKNLQSTQTYGHEINLEDKIVTSGSGEAIPFRSFTMGEFMEEEDENGFIYSLMKKIRPIIKSELEVDLGEYINSFTRWAVYFCDGYAVLGYTLDGEDLYHSMHLREEGYKGFDTDTGADERVIAVMLNDFSNLVDKNSLQDMKELNREHNNSFSVDALHISSKVVNITHMAKELEIHKNTLYRLQKDKDKKFDLYFDAYKARMATYPLRAETVSVELATRFQKSK